MGEDDWRESYGFLGLDEEDGEDLGFGAAANNVVRMLTLFSNKALVVAFGGWFARREEAGRYAALMGSWRVTEPLWRRRRLGKDESWDR